MKPRQQERSIQAAAVLPVTRGGVLIAERGEDMERKWIVRRLTPTECGRLQGFPDGWTDDVEGSDSARYKLWGNGIALPCAVDVLGRIAKELKRGISNEETRTAAEIHPLAGDHAG